jgi:hypothetical protein
MSLPPPIYFIWDGETMQPMARFARIAEAAFERGRAYKMMIADEASSQTRRHFFACVREAWANLPEALALEYPTPEHLRKRALILTGFCDEQIWAVPSPAEATRTAAALRKLDEFAVVVVKDNTVRALIAKSQASGRMGRAEFQKSKTAVLDYLAKLIDTTPEALKDAGRAA